MLASMISLSSHVLVTSFKVFHSVVPAMEYVASYWTSNSSKVDVNTKHLEKGDPLPPFNGKLRIYNMRYCPFAHRAILALNAKQVDYEVVNVDLMNKPEWMSSNGVGDPLPPYNGKLRMYNMRFCPFAQRTMLALIAKDIEFDLVNVSLKDKPDWLFKKSAFGKVPALEIEENVTIFESLPTVEYLDDVYPNRRLLPKNPLEKAHSKMIVEATGSIHNLFVKLVKKPEYITENNIQAFLKSLDFIQDELIRRGTKFLHGSEPGYSDYMIWPWFERLPSTEEIDPRARINRQNYGTLIKYINNMMQDPAVNEYLVPVEIMKKFHNGFKDSNGPYYDLLTEH